MNKFTEVENDYQRQLGRKQKRIEKYQAKQFDDELSIAEQMTLTALESECRLIKEFLNDLEYLQKLRSR